MTISPEPKDSQQDPESERIAKVFIKAAQVSEQRRVFDPVEAILIAQGYEPPTEDAPLARAALWLIRKKDNIVARVHAELGGGQLLTDEQMLTLTEDDWAGITLAEFDPQTCPDDPEREWGWWLRWSALDVRWMARRDAQDAADWLDEFTLVADAHQIPNGVAS